MANVQYKGVDVSVWQGNIDWAEVASHVDFAILRAGYGRLASQIDKKFNDNYKGVTDNQIPAGVYWYNYAVTVDDAKAEAKACLEVLKGKKFDYPVFYDIEEKATTSLGKTKVSAIADAFLTEIKNAGYKVGIYSFADALTNSFTAAILSKYDVWVAHVGVSKPSFAKPYTIWQNTWTGKVAGISGNVDCNICYVDYVGKKEEAPKETPKEEPKKPAAKTDADYNKAVEDVLAGKYGNGAERVQKLTAAGFDATKVQNLVNKKLEASKPVNSGETLSTVALRVIRGDYGVGVARIQKLTAAGYNATNVQKCVNAILSGQPVPILPLYGKTVDQVAQEVIAGKYGNGEERKRRLEAEGYNYMEVQTRVNYLLSK